MGWLIKKCVGCAQPIKTDSRRNVICGFCFSRHHFRYF